MGWLDLNEYVLLEGAVRDRRDDDRSLVEALQLGEPTAPERLITTYGDRAYRLAAGITGNRPDAEEVVQDALWAVVRKIDTFRGHASFGSWLYRIVTNAAYEKLRRGRARGQVLPFAPAARAFERLAAGDPAETDWATRVDDPALQTELRLVLTEAINELPADYRAAVILRDVEGLSNVEIGAVLRIGVANAKSRVHRARMFLRKRLGASLTSRPQPRGRRQASPIVRVSAACGS